MTNGEKYKTAKARTNAFNDYCERKDPDCNGCPLSGNKEVICRYAWLDLEAEEEKPMDCPFCGSVCVVVETVPEGHYYCECVNGKDCNYGSRRAKTKTEAIAEHNKRCKAWLAYKEGEVK